MQHQIVETDKGTKGFPEMEWYGMPYPIKILKAAFNIGLESLQNLLGEEKKQKEELSKKYYLTEEEIAGVLDGKYIKKIKHKQKT